MQGGSRILEGKRFVLGLIAQWRWLRLLRQRRLVDMSWGSRLGRLAALSIAAVWALSLACKGFSSSAASAGRGSGPSGTTLPRDVVIPLSAVSRLFPEITRQAGTGESATATGVPRATRSVIYATRDGSTKVTITVDQYRSSNDASSAYLQAIEKSRSVPGFKPVPMPNVGQQAFAGTVTKGAETHVGLGTVDDTLIVGATLAGDDATADNTDKLVAVARTEDTAAKMALGLGGSR
jgi:hypothetical protein